MKTIKGQDVWDAYRKAKNEDHWLRRPYSGKPKSKATKIFKKTINRKVRYTPLDEVPNLKAVKNLWISKRRGIVEFD